MERLNSIIQQVFHQNIVTVTPILTGLTNKNFHVQLSSKEEIVVRVPRSENPVTIDYRTEQSIIQAVSPYHLDVDLLYYDSDLGIKITRYIKQATTYQACLHPLNEKLGQVAKVLQQLHQVPCSVDTRFDALKMLELYQSKVNDSSTLQFPFLPVLINKIAARYQETKLKLCHNDVVNGNLLFTPERLYLIDYEYAGLNDPYFDLASFLSENNIVQEEAIRYFLQQYFGDLFNEKAYQDVMTWYLFQDILWSTWAQMMYEAHLDPFYITIRLMKTTRALRNAAQLL